MMKCRQARRLFGAYWDDETTQAEREWLESHFASCAACRSEYEALAHTLELTAGLPRVEPAPDLVERTVARARRAAAAPDRVPKAGVQWVPVGATAALLVVFAMLMTPMIKPGPARDRQWADGNPPAPTATAPVATVPQGPEQPQPVAAQASEPVAAISDTLFDHAQDIEFMLDPVTVRRGQATMGRPNLQVQGEHAVITF